MIRLKFTSSTLFLDIVSYIKSNARLKGFVLYLLNMFPSLNIKLRKIYLKRIMGAQYFASEWKRADPLQDKVFLLDENAIGKDFTAINSSQQTPLEVNFHKYMGGK